MRRRVDVDDGLHVVVRDHGGAGGAHSPCDAAQRHRPVAAVDLQVVEIAHRVDPVLRRLDDDRVGHAVLRIEPEGRIRLQAAGEVDLHVRRHVLLGQADLAGERAVDVHVQRRVVEDLLDARVGDSRHLFDLDGRSSPRRRLVFLALVADDLHVDGRRQAEIEDLADDVGRQEGEGGAGETSPAASRAACRCSRRSSARPAFVHARSGHRCR